MILYFILQFLQIYSPSHIFKALKQQKEKSYSQEKVGVWAPYDECIKLYGKNGKIIVLMI